MRVLFVTAEAFPLAKSGGLADVASALPAAHRRRGIDMRLLLPGYPAALEALENRRIERKLAPFIGIDDAVLISGTMPGTQIPVWLIYAPSLYSRAGGLYQDRNGRDWPDNARRFAYLAHAGAAIAGGLLGWKPDIVHANDWHTGLLPLLLSNGPAPKPATVFTIHNLGYQGNFPRTTLPALGIPEHFFNPDGLEFYGQVSFLKSGIRFSNKLTTVSPTYAKEVLTPEFGCGLDGVLRGRARDFSGILNGIDDATWNPATDKHLASPYNSRDIAGKRLCKAHLQLSCGLKQDAQVPLIAFVSRLVHQKMADVLIEALPAIADRETQIVLMGKGDPSIEAGFEALGDRHANVSVRIGYDEEAAHRLQAGADMLLAPARYEPCGLTQLYALRYGTVPIVRRTGGLNDTVRDAGQPKPGGRAPNGFAFDEPTASGLLGAVDRALAAYREPLTWRRLQLEGMAEDFGWNRSAARYAALYGEVFDAPSSREPRSGGAFEPARQVAI